MGRIPPHMGTLYHTGLTPGSRWVWLSNFNLPLLWAITSDTGQILDFWAKCIGNGQNMAKKANFLCLLQLWRCASFFSLTLHTQNSEQKIHWGVWHSSSFGTRHHKSCILLQQVENNLIIVKLLGCHFTDSRFHLITNGFFFDTPRALELKEAFVIVMKIQPTNPTCTSEAVSLHNERSHAQGCQGRCLNMISAAGYIQLPTFWSRAQPANVCEFGGGPWSSLK